MNADALREKILSLVSEFAELAHKKPPFVPGESTVPVSGRVYDGSDIQSLVDSSLDFWLTTGRFNEAFEKKLEAFLGAKYALTVNSGSSANLLAVAALTSPTLKEKALKRGDEVITVAAGFPTTVNPLLQYGLVPVFVDVDIPTYNVDASRIEGAITDKTRAIIFAHTLGNPFNLEEVSRIAKKYNLWLIEDCCDALGTRYQGKLVGSFGDIGTVSFYPAHHITMGEGGAVFTNNSRLKVLLESFRDWGRDCYCAPGKDNTCKKRFEWELGTLPAGYDHKYIYSHIGYNLKITDMQAAVGLSQIEKLPGFIEKRKVNFDLLKTGLADVAESLILPEATRHGEPSWFGFPITVAPKAGFTRRELIAALEGARIQTRLLFAGNLTRQPYFAQAVYRVHGGLVNTDRIMNNTFWLGVYPGLTGEMIDYVLKVIHAFVKGRK
ncbi:MAG: lipopolysaccharide biosynthesis protein RfbH [Deltaproteobacteria bacterium]|nr:lipopolysaccharide biosynthesis protein RfbH [Deltaproteobacteria bacterium]